MQITLSNEESDFQISYRKEDGYDFKRLTVLLYDRLSRAGQSAGVLRGYRINLTRESEDQTKASPTCRIDMQGKDIDITVGGILAAEAVLKYFDGVLQGGALCPASLMGDEMSAGANVYAFRRHGTHRIMYYNILWDSIPSRAPGERNIMTADLVREFSPEVVGFQECGRYKRIRLYSNDIVTQMERVGYREAPVADVKNSYHDCNCTPLFYKESEVSFIEGAYHWYSMQTPGLGEGDASSKSFSWGVFESRKTGERYIAVSNHMCTQVEEIREQQAQEAIRLFTELHERYGLPIVLGGDFNSNHHDRGYRCFRDFGKYDSAAGLATEYVSPEKTFHPYPEFDPELGLCMPNGGAEYDTEKSIDHILFPAKTDSLKVALFGVVVNAHSLATSDHFPVFADFTF